jgi:hypothetical protein
MSPPISMAGPATKALPANVNDAIARRDGMAR